MADVKDPVAALLDRDEHREDMLRNLGQSLNNLAEVTDEYKAAWKAAVGVGWLKADLARVGFVDPTKLPPSHRLTQGANPHSEPRPFAVGNGRQVARFVVASARVWGVCLWARPAPAHTPCGACDETA